MSFSLVASIILVFIVVYRYLWSILRVLIAAGLVNWLFGIIITLILLYGIFKDYATYVG